MYLCGGLLLLPWFHFSWGSGAICFRWYMWSSQDCCKTVHVHKFPLIVNGWQGFHCQLGMKGPSFYFSWAWAPLLIWKSNWLSSFSSTLSGIMVCSKAQLVSSGCCMATFVVTKIFYFFVVQSGMCWTGLGPSCTESLEVPTFHVPSLLILLVFEESWRDGEALLHCCLSLPHYPNVRNLSWGCKCPPNTGLIIALSFKSKNA